jgi:hypothetical protein
MQTGGGGGGSEGVTLNDAAERALIELGCQVKAAAARVRGSYLGPIRLFGLNSPSGNDKAAFCSTILPPPDLCLHLGIFFLFCRQTN